MERATAGSVLHAVGDEGVPTRPSLSRPKTQPEHSDWIGAFFGLDAPASSALTQQRLGWQPTHLGLIADLEQGRSGPPSLKAMRAPL
jgi:hypothetical protein